MRSNRYDTCFEKFSAEVTFTKFYDLFFFWRGLLRTESNYGYVGLCAASGNGHDLQAMREEKHAVQPTLSKLIPRNYYAHTVNDINATSTGTGFGFDNPGPAIPEMRCEQFLRLAGQQKGLGDEVQIS